MRRSMAARQPHNLRHTSALESGIAQTTRSLSIQHRQQRLRRPVEFLRTAVKTGFA